MNNLDILRNFGAIAEELKNKQTSAEYWEKEELFLSKRIEENERFKKAIKGTNNKRFTI